ncbi:lamin tail domain-containing protein [Streptomyces sp. 147326]|uniref:lamin tail domain-containing protein n=1 Tax=Streptomyces sp. 147326 TaxID=3074379 RepID=UPI003857E7FB
MSASLATRRALSAALAAVALVGAAALPAAADDHRRDRNSHSSLVIGDVQYDSPARSDRSNRALNREWVEVKNTGRNAVNLRGFTLTDQQGNRYRFANLRLNGRSSVKVHTGQGRDTNRDVYQDRRHQIWNERDTATLRDTRGNVVDTESWGRGGHHQPRR